MKEKGFRDESSTNSVCSRIYKEEKRHTNTLKSCLGNKKNFSHQNYLSNKEI